MRRRARVFVNRQIAEVDGHPDADGGRHRDQHACADKDGGLPTSKARKGGRKTENSAHVETHRRGTGPTAKQHTNDKRRLCNIRQILFCTAAAFRRATAAAAIGAILRRRRDARQTAPIMSFGINELRYIYVNYDRRSPTSEPASACRRACAPRVFWRLTA